MFLKDFNTIKKIELDLSTLCNAKCSLCTRDKLNLLPYVRPLENIQKQISLFKNLKEVQLIGQISEPTLYPQFLKLVEFLKNKKLNLIIYTNGSTQNDIFWNQLGSILDENDIVQFTICGKNQKQHEKYRINTSLSAILNNASIIRKYHKIDRLTFIKFKYNENDLYDEKFLNIKNQFSDFMLINSNVKSDLSIFKQANEKEFEKLEKISSFLMRTSDPIQCSSIYENFIYIDIYGNIYPCCLFYEQSLKDNIFSWSYEKIMKKQYLCCKYCQSKILKKLDEGDFDGC